MSKTKFILSRLAFGDLDDIWNYTSIKWSSEQAKKYVNFIFDEIDLICLNPKYGKNMDHIKENYKAARIKSHLIIYKIDEINIEIIRILHEKMDIIKQLS